MAYRPSLRSIWTLVMLAAVCIALYSWCEASKIQKKSRYYGEKLAAAKLVERALNAYQQAAAGDSVVITEAYEKDPRLAAVIGQQFTSITTDFGVFESKLMGTNPNFAGIVVELLKEAGLHTGDVVAIGFTGSHPGVNTAVLCACEVLGLKALTISSVGSSWWGANAPDYTWPDMERTLISSGLVHSHPLAASYGGSDDIAAGLSPMGQELLRSAIQRNQLPLIRESTVSASVSRRVTAYSQAAAGSPIKAYVNVGGGVASLGHAENMRLIPNGLSRKLPLKNYPARGVIHQLNAQGIPVINFHDIELMGRAYGLGSPRVPLPEAGSGDVFEAKAYDVRVAAVAAAIAVLILIVLVKLDARLFRLREAGVDPDTLM
ncbi:poly-gamma-glutamate system protein [candidate division KSB1 bacterium]|nr:poly-gamma-glutamate system protein [candidate division KSB1 bacterium]